MMSPHVSRSDQQKIQPRRLFLGLTGGDVDEDEVS